MTNPAISVIMLVYNARPFIMDSVESILGQTFSDFELLIFDDHSTDGTVEILKSLDDPRIKLFTKNENKGLVDSLNKGLRAATGKYIARMDGDDISMKDRFQKQYDFMEQHAEVVCCGTNYVEIPSGKKSRMNLSNEEIVIDLLSNSPFAHPTVMMRRETLHNNNLRYDPEWELAEDFHLWTRLQPFGKLANLPDCLLQYRVHANQYSAFRKDQQKEKALKVAAGFAGKLSKNHEWSEVFSRGELKTLKDVGRYSEVEKVIRRTLIQTGLQKADRFLRHRKRERLKRALMQQHFSSEAIKLLISSGTFLGLKFYISYMLGGFKARKK